MLRWAAFSDDRCLHGWLHTWPPCRGQTLGRDHLSGQIRVARRVLCGGLRRPSIGFRIKCETKMKTKTLHQTVKFKASPKQVYEMLMDSRKHRSLSGMRAKISRRVGGKFTAWGTHISGFNLALYIWQENCTSMASHWLVARSLLDCHL